jgi:hypothetical protein
VVDANGCKEQLEILLKWAQFFQLWNFGPAFLFFQLPLFWQLSQVPKRLLIRKDLYK